MELEVFNLFTTKQNPGIETLVVSPDPNYGGPLSPLSRIIDLSSDVSLCPTNSTVTMDVLYKTVCKFHVIHCSGRLPDNAMVSPMDIPNTVSIKLSLLSLHAPGSVSYCATSMASSRLGRFESQPSIDLITGYYKRYWYSLFTPQTFYRDLDYLSPKN